MSQATAKATRREIRRAVGVNGLDAVNQLALAVYQHILPTLNAQAITLKEQQIELTAFRSMSFGDRFRWLITGSPSGWRF